MSETVLRLSYASEDELSRKLITIMERRGYVVTPACPERISVGELARRAGRNASNVSQRLRSPACPLFSFAQGKRRFLYVVPNPELLAFLRESYPGRRSDLV